MYSLEVTLQERIKENDLAFSRITEHNFIITIIMIHNDMAVYLSWDMLLCVNIIMYLQNSSNVVSASLDCVLSNPVRGSALPPNMVTSVTSSRIQKAVVD